MYWFGWEWIAHAKRIAVLLRGAVASDGVHGPRACVIWGCIMPDCWHDWTGGQSWFLARTHLCLSLVVSSMIMLFLMWLVVIHNFIYRIKATSLCATWKAANFREMFSIFFSISTSSLLLKAVTLFLFVR